MDKTGKVDGAYKELQHRREKQELERAAKELESVPLGDCARLRNCSMQELLPTLRELDAIVTDPPYSEEFLPLYGELARLAKMALKPDGVLAVMCGQSYVFRIGAAMERHLPYRWQISYLTPGGQAAQLWDRKVNSFWKPVILFGGADSWIGDVVKSDVNDNDKRYHEWGQSVSGMTRLVEMLTKPGDLVCDPFMGAGTTGVACVSLARRFVGCDIDPAHVETARRRILLAAVASGGAAAGGDRAGDEPWA
jgi:DNA modification methylase